ncbi:glycosyl transferase [Arcobacter sp. CECT 8989]|uniref:nucleotidyltransferase family protein n=1 Tax=Arcobacter sp. CECT 8989 TaxID=2044509 RepID=UPI00100A8DE6|nr:nucleotidyltransferase family protein [Arcobacter sp. CECT 8989]RXJ98974.1 glycosyl transferase [Arcobacter sp. CECT 8989]
MINKKLAVLILAAGTSSRLGESKQLVRYKRKTLLEHACQKALEVSDDVFVVLGSNSEICKEKIKNLSVKTIFNKDFREGLSSSIRTGISRIEEYDNVLIMLCDQPFIPVNHMKKIVNLSQKENKIICSLYNQKHAVPVIFPKKYFNQLKKLNGDTGAKIIIMENNHTIIPLEDKYAIDIDTKEDLKLLKLN